MYFKSIDDLDRDIIKYLYKFQIDIDLIVGVPRSGLLVANMIALNINLPLVDLQGFIEGRIFESGKTRRPENYEYNLKNIRKVLIVEDSICSGNSLSEVKKMINSAEIDKSIDIIYFAAYIVEDKKNDIDFYLEICDLPRVFEWNIMHHSIIDNSFLDLDGVLCIDPSKEVDDDGEKYIDFIKDVKPLFIPTKKINTIVTCRLEKYRDFTIEWLNKNNIKFNNLIMMNYNSKEERIRHGKHAEFKAYYYKKSNAELFVESNLSQAIDISKISKKPVYCLENRKMIYPNMNLNIQYFGQPSNNLRIRKNITKLFKKILPKQVIKIIKWVIK
jgi:uncharacterized HAD superfamily protein/adenine/guanine phosphoribosyltransferase-like PRPP-binding protein